MDVRLFRFLNAHAGWGLWTDYLAWFLAVFGLGLQVLLVLVRWFFPGARRRGRRWAILAVVGATLAVGLAQMPQFVYHRPRPHLVVRGAFDLVGVPPSGSFPSIHATAASALATVMSWESEFWACLNWPLALGTSWSRVYAGIHYPSDVVAGLVIGFLAGWALMELRPDLQGALDRIVEALPHGPRKR